MGRYDLATIMPLLASRIVAYCFQVIVKAFGVFFTNSVNVFDNGIGCHLVMPSTALHLYAQPVVVISVVDPG